MCRLVALHNAENKHVLIPVGKPLLFGRKANCDVIETSIVISGNHCVLTVNGSSVEVSDLSSNGTFVNEQLIGKGNKVVLKNGDLLDLAKPVEEGGVKKPVVRYRLEIGVDAPRVVRPPSPSEVGSRVVPPHDQLRSLRAEVEEGTLRLSLQAQRLDGAERKLRESQDALSACQLAYEKVTQEKAELEVRYMHGQRLAEGLRGEVGSLLKQAGDMETELRELRTREGEWNRKEAGIRAAMATVLAVLGAQVSVQPMPSAPADPTTPFAGVACTLPDDFDFLDNLGKRVRLTVGQESMEISEGEAPQAVRMGEEMFAEVPPGTPSSVADLAEMLQIPM